LDSALLQAEALLAAKLAAFQRAIDVRSAQAAVAARKSERGKIGPALKALRVGSEPAMASATLAASAGAAPRSPSVRQRQLQGLLEFVAREDALLDGLDHALRALEAAAERDARQLGAMVDELQDTLKEILMLPVSAMLEGFPKLVRDLCRDCDKEADLVIEGGEIAIDKRIIEELHEPFIHLLRNSVDHGIERAQERNRHGKPSRGKITLAVSQQDAGRIEIRLADDGAGIDSARVRMAAAKVGIAIPEDSSGGEPASLPGEVSALVFESGVSTSPIITETSGRGLGLAIVREKVEKLGGSITAASRPGLGTQFRIVVPVRLATYRAIRVRANDEQFVLPTTLVEQVGRVDRAEIKTVENRATIPWRGEAIALTRLADVLELPRSRTTGTALPDKMSVVLVHAAARRHAFSVDEVLSEQEVLVKSFGQQLRRVRNIAGAALLGTGKVVPILNVADLMKSALRVSERSVSGSDELTGGVPARRKSILVAEDSITSRNLLKHILDAAGYEVRTAVDGIDAFIQLRTGKFDLVVSDVDMPRMNGFGLTQKIRADQKLADIPVVLVTALASREDRERGVDAGASAYVIKSSFDQSNLLEIVQGLL
jgi:two-component system chemotaxis sensor kinase CheA